MTTSLSKTEQAALDIIAEHGAVRIVAASEHLPAYERLVSLGLAFADAFDETARFYGLTEPGKLAALNRRMEEHS